MIDDILLDVEERMGKAVNILRADLLAIRTGRASPALIERLPVECYGSVLPLNQAATIGVPEPRLLTIRPWDGSIIGDIEKAILRSDLGLTPANDGRIIRLPIPPPHRRASARTGQDRGPPRGRGAGGHSECEA